MVVGSSSSDEAKIGGMTPEVLSFSGRCEDSPRTSVADLALGILDQQPRCARSMNTMKAITATAITMTPMR
jgi:hypothetical protein